MLIYQVSFLNLPQDDIILERRLKMDHAKGSGDAWPGFGSSWETSSP